MDEERPLWAEDAWPDEHYRGRYIHRASKMGYMGALAGAFTGCVSTCMTYPLEYVKVQLQLDGKGVNKKFDGIVDVIKKTTKKYGFFGMYKGLSVLISGAIPKSSIRFGTYEFIKSNLQDDVGNLHVFGSLASGLGAGIMEAILAVTPMDSIRMQLINDRRSKKPRFNTVYVGVTTIVKEQGVSGIYKGATATILKQGSNQTIRFFVMETSKNYYRKGNPNIHIPAYMTSLFGALAGATSVLTNTPFDVVKTRLQGNSQRYKGTYDCIMTVYKKEGVQGLYKGIIPRMSKVCVGSAVTFTLYEFVMEKIT